MKSDISADRKIRTFRKVCSDEGHPCLKGAQGAKMGGIPGGTMWPQDLRDTERMGVPEWNRVPRY